MDPEILIEARGLTRRFGPNVAVSGLELTLRKGEVLGLLGPNGAGKTTSLRMLSGCLAPSAGEVRICGDSMGASPKRAKTHLGYLPEQPPLYPELTVNEYLAYCAALHGVPSAKRAAAVARAKRACVLDEMSHRLLGNLSKGFQQRVGIAQAIIHEPEVIILDEPTIGLDPNQIREIRSLVKSLGEHHGVILSSHILSEVQAVCGRVMIIHRGRVVYAHDLREDGDQPWTNVLITLRHPPADSALRAIAGVAGVETLAAGAYRIVAAKGADPREALAQTAVQQGWGLLELRAEIKTLEETFVELTMGGTDAATSMKEAA